MPVLHHYEAKLEFSNQWVVVLVACSVTGESAVTSILRIDIFNLNRE